MPNTSTDEEAVKIELKKTEEEPKKQNNLAAMFQQNMEEEDERKVVLTKSEELLSSPDRRSLKQVKMGERFVNSVVNVVNTEEDEGKSDSQSSEEEKGEEESKTSGPLDVELD